MAGCGANLDLDAEKLNCEIQELENSVKHLRRSNEELAEALKANPGDEDFEAALRENETVIVKREALLEELRKELQGLKASLVQSVNSNLAALDLQPPPPAPAAVAVPVAVATTAQSAGPQMGFDVEEGEEGPEEKAEGVYL